MNRDAIEKSLAEAAPGAIFVVPKAPALCGQWQSVFGSDADARVDATLDLWRSFENVLPKFTTIQQKLLADIAAVRWRGLLYVAYFYRAPRGLWCFLGGMPLVDEAIAKGLETLPPTLYRFYRELHNGYFYAPNGSLGPLARFDRRPLDEIESDWGAQNDRQSEFEPLDEKVVMFWNGGPGYLALDEAGALGDDARAIIWWTDEPGEWSPFWPTLDAWMEIGLSQE